MSFERTMSTRSVATPVKYGWEELLDQKINLLKKASLSGNTQLLAAVEAQDRLSEVDHVATFYREARSHGSISLKSSEDVMDSLKDHALEANRGVKSDADDVDECMRQLADKGDDADPSDWEFTLDEQIDTMKVRSAERWEELRSFGKRRIRELPQSLRPPAARAYGGSLNAIAQFVDSTIRWLTNAIDTIAEWFKQAWAKIKEWAHDVVNWFESAADTIGGWFGAFVDQFGEQCSPRPTSTTCIPMRSGSGSAAKSANGGALDLEGIKAKLEKVGLDRFLLVRKGNEWVAQLEL